MPSFTKQAIVEAFLKLAARRQLARITVKDVVDACRINRNTFYYYFKDIYNVAEEVFLFEEETRRLLADGSAEARRAYFDGIVGFLRDHRSAVLNMYASVAHDGYDRFFTPSVGRAVDDAIRRAAAPLGVDEGDRELISRFYQKGVIGILTEWIRGGMKESAAFTVARLIRLLEGSARPILEHATRRPETSP
ncbi:MAG: TetR/AcrR family transcriptional regulator C-terminal domain-containing protein [Clostridia bacterium]|nr:TetR/AcrR family transcriptional regulator C-terminal domain-containing protein [Clostridia bacterium]